MKKTRILMAWLLAACPAVFAQTAYLENVKVENRSVEKQGRMVKVAMDVKRLVPTLVSADGTQEQALEPIEVNGKVRNKVLSRRRSLGDLEASDAQTTLRRKNGRAQTVHYETEVPFRR